MCFALEWTMQLINTTAEAVGESALAAARAISFTFEALDALDYAAQAASTFQMISANPPS
jgi:hypothetical protein